jgi:hypothetical protein
MKSLELKKGTTFSISGEKYVIEDNLLLPENAKADDFPLQHFGNMWQYRIDENRFVMYHCERYPCFDSYDYQYENRYRRTYYLCRSLEEMQKKYDYMHGGAIYLSNLNPGEKYRRPLCPYVYCDDGRETVGVYGDDVRGERKVKENTPVAIVTQHIDKKKKNTLQLSKNERFWGKVITVGLVLLATLVGLVLIYGILISLI